MTTRPNPAWIVWIALALPACSGDGDKSGKDTDKTTVGDDDDDDDTEPPTQVEVFINEVMSQNQTGLTDETGAFPDWVELYNAGDEAVDLEGYWLTDDVSDIFNWQFPADVAIIEPGGFLVVLCDGDTGDGPLHSSFSVSSLAGEDIGLFGPNVDDNPEIDVIEDMELGQPDTSFARMPDGGPTIQRDGTSTPGEPNE